MKEYIIIVAGGTGSRMQSDMPKQFLLLHGKEIILHTIDRFLQYNPQIQVIISCHNNYISHTKKLLQQLQYPESIIITAGGETRFHSVLNGLNTITDPNSVVGVHDAARPLVSRDTIARCYSVAKEKGNAIPVVAIHESLRKVEGENSEALDRSAYKIVQTPQCFHTLLLKSAFEQNYTALFTDDASVLEKAGHRIHLTEGNTENIKITLPTDILLAEVLLKKN